MLQSSQCKQTTTPEFYKNYLCTLATKGEAAACKATYAGASPLQTQAFNTASQNLGATTQDFNNASGLIGCASNVDISGAAAPYLQGAATGNTGQMAQCYMSPYINSAVQNASNIGMRNIDQNLTPQATASAVGSGQFGSQRGAQAIGQVQANAMQCLNSNIGSMEGNAYKCAMSAAEQKQSLLGQLGSTAGNEATNQANVLNNAGTNLATIGSSQQRANVSCLCAVSKLGAECQAIRQNAACYCLNKENKLAGVLQGAQIPTGVKTTATQSPLSGIASVGAIGAGILCKYGKCIASGLGSLISGAGNLFGCSCKGYAKSCAPGAMCIAAWKCCAGKTANSILDSIPSYDPNNAKSGGLIKAKSGGAIGCASTRNRGGLPSRR